MKKKILFVIAGILVISLAMAGLVFAQEDPGEASGYSDGEDDVLICSGEMIHPVLEDLSTSYEVNYDELLSYFCKEELSLGDLKHALSTAELGDVNLTYDELLVLVSDEGMTWGEIWQMSGLIGRDGFDVDKDGDKKDDMDMSQVCSGEMEHPVLLRLSHDFKVDYEILKGYFCEEKFGIGELKNALKRSTAVDEDWEDILDKREGDEEQKTGWGLIWQELGLIGKDKVEKDMTKPEDHPGRGKGLDKKP
jgi:hypothetical protein